MCTGKRATGTHVTEGFLLLKLKKKKKNKFKGAEADCRVFICAARIEAFWSIA
jgi:hypothetical protein